MATAAQHAATTAWSMRLTFELTGHDETAKALLAGLTVDQLNWQPAPGSWSIGQCLEHICITNELYLPAISAAIEKQPDAPVEQIIPGPFARWFLRNFIEPSPKSKRAPAPGKTRPMSRVEPSVLDRLLSVNKSCRELILHARAKDVNVIRFWNPFVRGLRFTVGTGLQIIVSHELRHLLQAERVRDSASFPH